VDVDFFNTWEGRLISDKGLLAMISYYGATIGGGLVLDLASLPMPHQDPGGQFRMIRYPPWVGVLENRGGNHPLTSNFAGADLFWASPITFTLPESGDVIGEVLFSSTEEAWLMTNNFSMRPEPGNTFLAEADATRGEKILAVALTGRFPSWFEDVEKPRRDTGGWDEESWEILPSDELPDLPTEARETRLVVIGDVDMGSPLIQYTQGQQSINLDFLLLAADWLGNDDDIVGIRNRRSGTGRLDRISDEIRRAGMMGFSRILNIFIMPAAIIIFGIYRLLKRKQKTSKEQDHAL
jgi:ABC-type uncharacterized transport system involved in gliding motility auxiliary subunit